MLRIALTAIAIVAPVALPAAAGALVTTQQSVSYELPDGWSVEHWTVKTGEAILKSAKTGDTMSVERFGLTGDVPQYPNVETLDDGNTFSWDYAASPLNPADFTLSAQITFADANAKAWINLFASSLKSIDKEGDLAAMRAIAKTLKITGPRKCWPAGECPPGEVK